MKITITNLSIYTNLVLERDGAIKLLDASGLGPTSQVINITQFSNMDGGLLSLTHSNNRQIALTVAVPKGGTDAADQLESILSACRAGDECEIAIEYSRPGTLASVTSRVTINGVCQAPAFSQFDKQIKVLLVFECAADDFSGTTRTTTGLSFYSVAIQEDYGWPVFYVFVRNITEGGQRVIYNRLKLQAPDGTYMGITCPGINDRGEVTVVFDCRPGKIGVTSYLGLDPATMTTPVSLLQYLETGSRPIKLHKGGNFLTFTAECSPATPTSLNGKTVAETYVKAIVDRGILD